MSDRLHNPDLIHASIFGNGYKQAIPWITSIGFRTHALRHRADGPLSRVAEDFLVNSRLVRDDPEGESSIESYLQDHGTAMVSMMGEEAERPGRRIALPRGAALDLSLGNALERRQSVRHYTGDPLPVEYLAALLAAGCGITHAAEAHLWGGGTVELRFRAAPSAGGLYPVELYVGACNVRGLDRGVYRYQPFANALLGEGDGSMLNGVLDAFSVPDEMLAVSQAAAVVLLVAHPWKSMRKYGPRGMRFVFQETGAISQNLHLAAAALGIGSVDCASLYDDEVHDALGLDGVFRTLTHAVVLGIPG